MIFSWRRLAGFFAALAVIAWLIHPDAYFRGLMHRRDADKSVSVQLYRDYLRSHPHSKSALLALAAAYESQADPEAAAEVLESLYAHRRGDLEVGRQYLALLERSAHGPQAQELRWRLYEDARGAAGADKHALEELLYGYYQRAALAQDDAAARRALTALADVGKNRDSYVSALVRLTMARRDFPELERLLAESKRRSPGDLYTRLSLIYVFQTTKDFPAALREINEAFIVRPDDLQLVGARASVNAARGRLDLALPDLERLAAAQPREPAWRRDLAAAWLKSLPFEAALAKLRELQARFPRDEALRRELIYACSDHGLHEEAAALLEPLAKSLPDDEELSDLLAFQYEKLGRKARETEVLEDFARRHPGGSSGRRRRLAQLLAEQGCMTAFAELARPLIAENPGDKELRWSLIYGLEDARRWREAAVELEAYLRDFPGDPDAVDELTQDYINLGQKAKAIALLQRNLAAPKSRTRRSHAAP